MASSRGSARTPRCHPRTARPSTPAAGSSRRASSTAIPTRSSPAIARTSSRCAQRARRTSRSPRQAAGLGVARPDARAGDAELIAGYTSASTPRGPRGRRRSRSRAATTSRSPASCACCAASRRSRASASARRTDTARPPRSADAAATATRSSRLCEELVPEAARDRLAKSVDVYCDEGAFTLAESARDPRRGRAAGLAVRGHVGQFADLGGAELLAELGGLSADHVEQVRRRDRGARRGAATSP